jgi:hypothetical protein
VRRITGAKEPDISPAKIFIKMFKFRLVRVVVFSGNSAQAFKKKSLFSFALSDKVRRGCNDSGNSFFQLVFFLSCICFCFFFVCLLFRFARHCNRREINMQEQSY